MTDRPLCATQQAREELRTKIAAVLWPPNRDERTKVGKP